MSKLSQAESQAVTAAVAARFNSASFDIRPAPEQPELHERMEALEYRAVRILEQVECLEKRLTCVCRQSEQKNGPMPTAVSKTQIGERTAGILATLERASSLLTGIEERLEV